MKFLLTFLMSLMILTSGAQDAIRISEIIDRHAAEKSNLDKDPASLGISHGVLAKVASMKNPPLNIALFGVDRRDTTTHGNADMIMIVSIDPLTKKIKLISFLRDTYVNIAGLGKDKINAAYAHGGAQLAIRAINENFSMDIQDYISIDFFGSAKIIDALGGITMTIRKEEIPYLNNYLDEIGGIKNTKPVKIKNAGIQKLNGEQTVAFSRIRAIGNDYERTDRQRRVMAALMEKLHISKPETFTTLAFEVLPHMETSMSKLTLFSLGAGVLKSESKSIQGARFPLDADSKGVTIDGIWYLTADLKKTAASIHDFIYRNVKPEENGR